MELTLKDLRTLRQWALNDASKQIVDDIAARQLMNYGKRNTSHRTAPYWRNGGNKHRQQAARNRGNRYE